MKPDETRAAQGGGLRKKETGVGFFDRRHGGVYEGRAWVVSGASGSGKSAVAMQFLAAGLRRGERGLLLSTQPAEEVMERVATFGPEVKTAVDGGNLTLLDYAPIEEASIDAPPVVPPDGFLELQALIEDREVHRVAIDTAVPWLAMTADRLEEHAFSFVRAMERMGATTLLTLPRPHSALARRLHEALFAMVPVAAAIEESTDHAHGLWRTRRYVGDAGDRPAVPIALAPGIGVYEAGGEEEAPWK